MSSASGYVPRELRARLPNGIIVSINTDGMSFTDPTNAQNHLTNVLQSTRPTETNLLRFLQDSASIAFPQSDPAIPAQILEPNLMMGTSLSYKIQSSKELGIVQDRQLRHSASTRLLDDQMDRFVHGSLRIGHVHFIVGLGNLDALRNYYNSNAWTIPVEIVSVRELVDRITLSATSEPKSEYTIILVEVVDSSRRLLALLARSPKLLEAIHDVRFEELVATLLHDLGFEEVELTPPRKDGGIDVIAIHWNSITNQREVYLFECKHWISGKMVHMKIATRLQEVVKSRKAAGGVLLAPGGFGPKLVEQEVQLRQERIHLKGKGEFLQWVEMWERTYGALLLTKVDPLKIVGLVE